MSSFELRAWQAEALPRALAAIADGKKGVVSAVMGAGKSVLIRELVARWLADPARSPGRVVVTTPTVRLVDQLAATLGATLEVGKYYTHAKEHDRAVVICCNASAQQLAVDLAGAPVGLWVADEAHKTEAESLIAAAEALRPASRLAVTATPYRSEERERVSLFDDVVYSYTPADALRDGVIVPWNVVGWDGQDGAEVDDACVEMIRRYRNGPGLANARSIDDAEGFAARLRAEGFAAKAIHSNLRPAEQAARVEDLRDGCLDVLVHVNMLAEGVDYPWLRWLLLRRQVGARVRFVQEVGRVLRAAPGKSEALLLDPHDLFGIFGLAYNAALGWAPAETATTEAEDDREEATQGPKEVRVYVRGRAAAWARLLLVALQAEGMAAESRVQGHAWRNEPPTEPQLKYLRSCAREIRRRLIGDHAETFRAVARSRRLLSRGVVSDLLSIAKALEDRTDQWSPSVDVPAPSIAALDAAARIELPEDTRWRCGYALTDVAAAVAVLCGDTVEYAVARPRKDSDTTEDLYASARRIARDRSGREDADIDFDQTACRMAMTEARRIRGGT